MPRAAQTLFLLVVAVLAACAPQQSGVPAARRSEPSASEPAKTLVLIARAEPETLAGTALTALTGSTGTRRRLFNAALTMLNGNDQPVPYLAEALPGLNSESWRVFPDGRMETTYRLRPNLTWHDGAALSADDFAFAFQVYITPELGRSNSEPINMMESVTAADDRVLRISWKQPYPEAGALEGVRNSGNTGPSFAPLPRHILERAFQTDTAGFASQPFWTLEFVGAGPYRLERWVPGDHLEGVAFDGHALGRPKIERVRLRFSADDNAVLANLLSGEAHIPVDDSIRIQAGLVLKREWGARAGGLVQFVPRNWRTIEFQHRAEYANPSAIRDLRVRKAIAHATDREAINEGLMEGVGVAAETMFSPTVDFFPEIDRAVAKYPFDPRRSDALMVEAGYQRGGDGFFAPPGRNRLVFEVTGTQSAQNAAERTILAEGWRRAGLDAEQGEFSAPEMRDGLRLSTFRSMYATGSAAGIASMMRFRGDNIAGPDNRWTRSNRGGWLDPRFDDLVGAVQSTLDRKEREQHIVEALKILTETLGVFSLYFNPTVIAVPSSVQGMSLRAAESDLTWNIHDWTLL